MKTPFTMTWLGAATLYAAAITLGLTTLAPKNALAQSIASNEGCAQVKENPDAPQADPTKKLVSALTMGKKIEQFMRDGNYRVAIVSRAGSDQSKHEYRNPRHPKYSHAGLIVPDGRGSWKFVHLLNTCSGPSSDIYEEGLAKFFSGDLFNYDFLITVPSPELQEKLEAVANDRTVGEKGLARSLHWPRYSNIAYPFSLEYQNSNMWLLTVIASGQSGAQTRQEAQDFYKRKGFKPTQVHASAQESFSTATGFKRPANVHTDAHPLTERMTGWLSFASAESVHAYLRKTDPVIANAEIRPDAGCNIKAWEIDK